MQGNGAHQKGVLQVAEVGVQRVLADSHALRAQGVVLLLDREPAARVRQQLPLQPTQGQRIGDPVALDDVAEHHHVDIAGQQRSAILRLHTLRLGKAAFDEVAPQTPVDRLRRRRIVAGVAQRLTEAERVHQHFHRAPAEAGRHLPAQQLGRGAGHEHFHAAGIDQTADELLPARNVLNFIQVQGHAAGALQLRKPPGVLLQQPTQVGDGEPGQPLVLQQEQQLRLGAGARVQACGAGLVEKRGLAAAAYPDYRERLAGDRRETDVAGRNGPGRRRQRLVKLRAKELSRYCHFASDNIGSIYPSVKDK